VDFDHGLNKAISKIREALGDLRRESLASIEKPLPSRGYRFSLPMSRRSRDEQPGTVAGKSCRASRPWALLRVIDAGTINKDGCPVPLLGGLSASPFAPGADNRPCRGSFYPVEAILTRDFVPWPWLPLEKPLR